MRRTAGWLAILMMAGLLMAGLWPFSFRPPNHVRWLQNGAGLSFAPDGIAHTAQKTDWSAGCPPDQAAAFSVELWLEPGHQAPTGVFHILSIDDGQSVSGLTLGRWRNFLSMRVRDPSNRRGVREVGVDETLIENKPRCITMTTDRSGTVFYWDDLPVSFHPGFFVEASRLKGQLVLGDAASGRHAWAGTFHGAAVYSRALDAAEVARHCQLWTNRQTGALASEPGLEGLYLFDQREGARVSDRSGKGRPLWIPGHYQVVRKRVLEPPTWGNADSVSIRDVVLNLLGFVPFGFLLFVYRRAVGECGRFGTVAWATGIGLAVSLGIELTQVWMPHRYSSATDLFCNTTGTALGALSALILWRKASAILIGRTA